MDGHDIEGWGITNPDESKVRRGFCQQAAAQLLKRSGVKEPPVPVEEVAKHNGFEISVRDLPPGVDARLRTTDDGLIIEVAAGQARVRHRFSVAHELGHATLQHRHGEGEVFEQEANLFANALLVPREWLRRDVKEGLRKLDQLAVRYHVSRDVIFIAAQRARLLDRVT